MTSRRASATGMHVRQSIAASRRNACSAALLRRGVRLGGLLLGGLLGLLLPASTVHAADTRSAHSHRPALQSAGKVPAHAVHDTEPRSSHTPDKTATPHGDRKPHSSAAAPRKGAAATRHAQDGEDTRTSGKTQGAHKRHKTPPADDPMPVNRAQLPRNRRDPHAPAVVLTEAKAKPLAHDAHAPNGSLPSAPVATQPTALRHTPRTDAPAPAETAQIGTGLTTEDFLRGARRTLPAVGTQLTQDAATLSTQASSVFASGVSHPDDDERLPLHSADANPHSAGPTPPFAAAAAPHILQPAPPARSKPAAPAQAAVTTALSESAPIRSPVVEGFGAEVDFQTPAAKPSRSTSIALPRESPAQQERELRAAADVAAQPMFVPLYARDGKLIVPPPLKGSHDILVHQNQMADDAGLTRIQDDDDLDRLRRAKLLVDFPESASLHVNESLPENRRCARPWTVKFATDIARSFYSKFGEPLQVNSAVRTVAYQLRLQRTNGNAAAIDGEGASPHLTGQALDFGKRGMSVAEIAWMRSYLMPLIDAGKIDVEEEFQQACFHISVYAAYMPASHAPHAPAATTLAQVTRGAHSHAPAAADIDENFR